MQHSDRRIYAGNKEVTAEFPQIQYADVIFILCIISALRSLIGKLKTDCKILCSRFSFSCKVSLPVSRVLSSTVIYLLRMSPYGSSHL